MQVRPRRGETRGRIAVGSHCTGEIAPGGGTARHLVLGRGVGRILCELLVGDGLGLGEVVHVVGCRGVVRGVGIRLGIGGCGVTLRTMIIVGVGGLVWVLLRIGVGCRVCMGWR